MATETNRFGLDLPGFNERPDVRKLVNAFNKINELAATDEDLKAFVELAATKNELKNVLMTPDWGGQTQWYWNGDLNEIESTGFVYTGSCANTPSGVNGYCLTSVLEGRTPQTSHKSQTFQNVGTTDIFIRIQSNGTWSAWAKIAKDVEPVWYDAVLENGWTSYANSKPKYSKMNGIVNIIGATYKTFDNVNKSEETIYTIPIGYRPKYSFNVHSFYQYNNKTVYVSISIDASGPVRVSTNCPEMGYLVHINRSFVYFV